MHWRSLIVSGLLFSPGCATFVSAQTRSIQGTYRNPAEGYSIKIPPGLQGLFRDEDGPQRGVRIPLPSGGAIVVFGEPNTFEYKSPEAGIRDELRLKDCESAQREFHTAKIGKLRGASGRLACDGRVLEVFLALRPRGGLIYWLRLDTTRVHEAEDKAALDAIAASFKLIPWK
jgi:hypothetical protein